MFENILGFFEMIGVDTSYPALIVLLLFAKCLVPRKVEYRIEETKNKDGNSNFDVYKIL